MELLTELYERMAAEQKKFCEWLLTQPPNVILDRAYEYSIREDMMVEMEVLELPEVQTSTLLKSQTSLADIYKEWQKTETHHMEDLRDVIENRADTVIRAEKEKNQREER